MKEQFIELLRTIDREGMTELLEFIDPEKTHKFYWEKTVRRSSKPIHPGENDPSLPIEIRGKHFDSWTDLAGILGYGE